MHHNAQVTEKFPSASFFEIAQVLRRHAAGSVRNVYHLAILNFISDRTLGWSKIAEFIPATHFLDGVQCRRTGAEIQAALPISRSQLYAGLKELKEAGILLWETIGHRVRYALNVEWVMSLKTPKRLKENSGEGFKRDAEDWGETVQTTDSKPLRKRETVRVADTQEEEASFRSTSNNTNCEAAPSPVVEREEPFPVRRAVQSLSATIAAASLRNVEKTAAKQAAKIAKGDPDALHATFSAAVKDTWPEALLPPLTGKQRGQLKHLHKSWAQEGLTVADFVEWSVQNWRRVHASKFVYIEDKVIYPDLPDLGFLMAYKKAFLDSYARRETMDYRTNLSRRDKLMRRFLFEGYSKERAEAQVNEVLSRETVREDLEKRSAELDLKARLLKRQEDALRGRAAPLVKPVAPENSAYTVQVTEAGENFTPPANKQFHWKDDE